MRLIYSMSILYPDSQFYIEGNVIHVQVVRQLGNSGNTHIENVDLLVDSNEVQRALAQVDHEIENAVSAAEQDFSKARNYIVGLVGEKLSQITDLQFLSLLKFQQAYGNVSMNGDTILAIPERNTTSIKLPYIVSYSEPDANGIVWINVR